MSQKRRRELNQREQDDQDARDQAERQEAPASEIPASERCFARLGRHDFSMASMTAGIKVFRCWYCSQLSPRSKEKLAAQPTPKGVTPPREMP